MFRFNSVNLDVLTETYTLGFYLDYLALWPAYQIAVDAPNGATSAYILGKAEGSGTNWHGHVSAVSVAPQFRRLGIARVLMKDLERISEHIYNAYFVDLFVRISNVLAIAMYERLGYVVYRQVERYYSGEEDAYDMRKALPRDPEKASMVPRNPLKVTADDLTM